MVLEDYKKIVDAKKIHHRQGGFEYKESLPHLFPFQELLVKWAIRKGKSAIFADTGLGKTAMQITWADLVHRHTKGKVIILAPLCVAYLKSAVRPLPSGMGI